MSEISKAYNGERLWKTPEELVDRVIDDLESVGVSKPVGPEVYRPVLAALATLRMQKEMLANALIAAVSAGDDRLLKIEDAAADVVNEYHSKSCDCDDHLQIAIAVLEQRIDSPKSGGPE